MRKSRHCPNFEKKELIWYLNPIQPSISDDFSMSLYRASPTTMHSRPHHKSTGSLNHHRAVDNTFRQQQLLPSTHFRACHHFAKQERLQRGYHEFEDGNQRRLIKRQNDTYKGLPRYI